MTRDEKHYVIFKISDGTIVRVGIGNPGEQFVDDGCAMLRAKATPGDRVVNGNLVKQEEVGDD